MKLQQMLNFNKNNRHFLRVYFVFCMLALICGSSFAQQAKLKLETIQDLRQFFKYEPGRAPLIFAHRGGTVTGLPENCIATYEYTVKTITPFLEIDPRLTKDSVIVILHDATLDRTTNGTGKLSDYTWAQIKELKLKDATGNLTQYGIPTLEETIKWAKGKCILMLDHKNVPLAMMVNKLQDWKATSQVILSAFELEVALGYYQLNKELLLEVYIKNAEQLAAFEKSGIPLRNMIAYVSQPKQKPFYDLLHAKGMMAMVYTATVIEKEKDGAIRKQAYAAIINAGGDMILADNVKEVSSVVSGMKIP